MMMVGAKSLHSRSYASKYKKRTKLFGVLGVVLFFVLLLATWWVTDRSPIVVEHLEIVGAEMTMPADIEARAQALLQTRFVIWSRNNILLAPRGRVREAIETEFPWIRDARVKLAGLSVLRIEIEEYTPAYIVCGSNQEACFFADESGYIFVETSGDNQTHVRWTYALPEEVVGTRITTRAEFAEFSAFISALEDNALEVKTIIISPTNEVRFVLAQGTHIIVDRKGNWENMLGHFLLLLAEQTNIHSTRDAFLRSTEYIDVRHGNKIFYKAYGGQPVTQGEDVPADNTQE